MDGYGRIGWDMVGNQRIIDLAKDSGRIGTYGSLIIDKGPSRMIPDQMEIFHHDNIGMFPQSLEFTPPY